MTFLPYEKFVIKTHLAPDIILKRLDGATETGIRWGFFWQEHKPYRGKITGYEFKISRWNSYRNDFRPIIKGRINPELGGSGVYVTMSMDLSVIVFMCLWLGFFLLISLASIGQVLAIFQSGFSLERLVSIAFPLGFLLFGYLLTIVSFKIEAIQSRKFLNNLLESNNVIELGLFETEPNI